MKQIVFQDLLIENTKIDKRNLIKNIALKKLAVCKFEDKDDSIITNVCIDGDEYEVVFNDATSRYEFDQQTSHNREKCISFMHSKMYNFYDFDSPGYLYMIREYKKHYYIRGSELNNEEKKFLKLYSKSPLDIDSGTRNYYLTCWIDYEKQLKNGNEIYDENNLIGLYATTIENFPYTINEQCSDHYGSSLLILKPVDDCMYLCDGIEIIGDRFEVLDKMDLSQEFFGTGSLARLYYEHFSKSIEETQKQIEILDDNIHSDYAKQTKMIEKILKYKNIAIFESSIIALLAIIILLMIFLH